MLSEGNKSGDNSLRDWFSKSKSSDGTPGWVQLGGKYAGKPCAKQPGQTTKPKCGSSKMKRNLSKDEEEAAFRRKNRQDPNPDRKGKAKNVATEETINEKEGKKDACYHKVKSRYSVWPSAYASGALVKCRKKGAKNWGNKSEEWVANNAAEYFFNEGINEDGVEIFIEELGVDNFIELLEDLVNETVLNEAYALTSKKKVKKRLPKGTQPAKTTKATISRGDRTIKAKSPSGAFKKRPEVKKAADTAKKEQPKKRPVLDGIARQVLKGMDRHKKAMARAKSDIETTKKIASKVGKGAKEFGKGFASGVKAVGKVAKSIKKEEFTPAQIKALESIGALGVNEEGQKCWKGYEKRGTKKMFGKTYNNCVKKEEFVNEGCGCDEKCSKCGKDPCECGTKKYRGGDAGKPGPDKNYVKPMGEQTIELTDAYGNKFAEVENIIEPEPIKTVQNNIEYETYDIESMTEATRVASKTGNIIMVTLTWKGKLYGLKMFFPQITKPSRSDVQDQIEKVYPGSRLNSFYVSEVKPGENFLQVAEGAAWTKKSGKSESGGLNEKGRKSYERENPGSDLKAPSKKVGNPRRKSFCARMKGMKAKLTSKKTASDPDSRINKSLRAWNC